MPNSDVIALQSPLAFAETVERFHATFAEKGITVFALIDHQQAAQSLGLTMHPATVIVFGNPRAGTPLMRANPQIAVDLPLKILIHEPTPGHVEVLYTAASEIIRRHPLPPELASNLLYAERLIADVLKPTPNR